MIAVDTSVWIQVLNGEDTPKAELFERLLEDGQPLALTEIVYTEILQGLRSDREEREVDGYLREFPVLELKGLDDFRLAAQLYRAARRKGVTIRRTLDCLIAAPCVRAGVPVLHDDADFDRLASCSDLRIFK